jgi:hypothetical protein
MAIALATRSRHSASCTVEEWETEHFNAQQRVVSGGVRIAYMSSPPLVTALVVQGLQVLRRPEVDPEGWPLCHLLFPVAEQAAAAALLAVVVVVVAVAVLVVAAAAGPLAASVASPHATMHPGVGQSPSQRRCAEVRHLDWDWTGYGVPRQHRVQQPQLQHPRPGPTHGC